MSVAQIVLTYLELGSEDDPSGGTANAGHATHPVRKRIAIKLRQGGKVRGAGGTSGKKTKVKSMKDSSKEGDLAECDNEDVQFGMNFCPHSE